MSLLVKNIFDLKLANKTKLLSENIENFIKKLDEKNKFDLIFLDPPYKDNSYLDVINLIKKKKLFKKNHKIVIHRERKSEENLDRVLNIDLLKNYGRSKIIFGSF